MATRLNLLKLSLLLLTAGWAGCSDSDRLRLVGNWQIDQIEEISEQVSTDEAAINPATKMSVDFYRSGRLNTATMIGSINSTKEGSWEFLEFQQDSGIMKIRCDLAMQSTEHEIEFENPDTIRWIPPNLAGTRQKIRFIRAKN